jgi:hypothetical protein
LKLFLDSDGVFADFDKHVIDLFGKTPHELGDAEMWRLANASEIFWDEMPLLPGAQELWAAFSPLKPTILTGCPRSDYDRAAASKRIWWKRHFDHDDVITCLSRDKALHMQAQGDWLIDDMSKNTKRWEKAGGRAYRYDGNAHNCLAFFRRRGII